MILRNDDATATSSLKTNSSIAFISRNIISSRQSAQRNGGMDGKPGNQQVIRANGELVHMDSVSSSRVFPGDRLVIMTPGGGGYGKIRQESKKAGKQK